ncbi:MAG: DoxX family protein, partial [Actinobacteria bacterium]
MSYGILLLRVVVGLAFVGHGTQKVFGWFGGYGPKGTGGFFASLGYRAGVLMAVAAGLSEAVGGTLLALGFVTPLAGALLAMVMINAIASVTFKKGFMLGSELEIAYLATAVALAAIGPGRFSIDRVIGWDDNISGVWWGVAALGAALVVSVLTLT